MSKKQQPPSEIEAVRNAFASSKYRMMVPLSEEIGLSESKITKILGELGGKTMPCEHKNCRRTMCYYEKNDELILEVTE